MLFRIFRRRRPRLIQSSILPMQKGSLFVRVVTLRMRQSLLRAESALR